MKVEKRTQEYEPIALILETMKELISIRAALGICLLHWHKEDSEFVDSHIGNIERALNLLGGDR